VQVPEESLEAHVGSRAKHFERGDVHTLDPVHACIMDLYLELAEHGAGARGDARGYLDSMRHRMFYRTSDARAQAFLFFPSQSQSLPESLEQHRRLALPRCHPLP
jgi:hypothetical protein